MTNEMTVEEVIMFIKEVLPFYLKPEQTTEWEICQKALDKTVELLEAQPIIPSDATNGDVIKAMFPDEEYKEGLRGDIVDGKHVNHKVVRVNGLLDYYVMDYDWWNAPYREGDAE